MGDMIWPFPLICLKGVGSFSEMDRVERLALRLRGVLRSRRVDVVDVPVESEPWLTVVWRSNLNCQPFEVDLATEYHATAHTLLETLIPPEGPVPTGQAVLPRLENAAAVLMQSARSLLFPLSARHSTMTTAEFRRALYVDAPQQLAQLAPRLPSEEGWRRVMAGAVSLTAEAMSTLEGPVWEALGGAQVPGHLADALEGCPFSSEFRLGLVSRLLRVFREDAVDAAVAPGLEARLEARLEALAAQWTGEVAAVRAGLEPLFRPAHGYSRYQRWRQQALGANVAQSWPDTWWDPVRLLHADEGTWAVAMSREVGAFVDVFSAGLLESETRSEAGLE